jgi:hypothetical protein
MVIEGQFLLAMRRVLGVIEVKNNRRWRLRVAGNEVVNKRMREAVEIGASHAVFEPGEGRSTRQGLSRIKRDAFDAQLEHGIVPETIGIIAIRIARRDLIDALGEEVSKRMVNIRGMAFVAYCSGQAFGEADLAVDAAQ